MTLLGGLLQRVIEEVCQSLKFAKARQQQRQPKEAPGRRSREQVEEAHGCSGR